MASLTMTNKAIIGFGMCFGLFWVSMYLCSVMRDARDWRYVDATLREKVRCALARVFSALSFYLLTIHYIHILNIRVCMYLSTFCTYNIYSAAARNLEVPTFQ